MAPSRALAYAREHRPRFLAELKDFIRFPTVSSQPERAGDLKRCAAWLAAHLRDVGLENVRMMAPGGPPVVYGAWQRARGSPTVLVYGHYDVVPADPLPEWRSAPFEPVVRGEYVFGRGASDDKGQMFAHVKAMESYLMTERALPVNVKCLFEGEEEIGSPNLSPFLNTHKRALEADAAVISDMPMPAPDRPAVTYALRGWLRVELEVRGPRQDLHSGNFGGAIHNPLQALCELLAALHDSKGRVAVPGFYDSVRRWSQEEQKFMARMGPSDAEFLKSARTHRGWGECGYTLYERATIRPALTLNGITGGHQGSGVKAAIPALARASLSFRLVPDQDPQEIGRLFRDHIARITPPTVRSRVRIVSAAPPALIDRDLPAVSAAAFAYRKAFGRAPAFLRCGGSVPVVNTFQKVLGIPAVLMGLALPDDQVHGPNERFHLPSFHNGIAASIWFLAAAGVRLRNVYGN